MTDEVGILAPFVMPNVFGTGSRLEPDAVGWNGGVCDGTICAIILIEVMASYLLHRSLHSIAAVLEAKY